MPSHHDKQPLREGMRAGDLEDMVLPLVSLDEYQSKITDGEDAIVLGLYVQDIQAADDLNRFVQKSAIDILDTERSPAPDQTGYFFVFVELPNNARLGDNIASILHEIGPLTGIDTWQVRLRGVPRILAFDADRIDKFFARRRERKPKNKHREQATVESSQLIKSVLRNTSGRMIEGELIALGEYDVVDRGPLEIVLGRNNLDHAAVSFKRPHLTECKRMARMLGDEINVFRIGDYYMVHDTAEAVLLRGR